MVKVDEKNPSVIISSIEKRYGFDAGDLKSKKISKYLSKARREAIRIFFNMQMSWTEIGGHLNREHSSVMKLVGGKKGVNKV